MLIQVWETLFQALPDPRTAVYLGAAVEAVSIHGLDNLTIQVAAAGAAWYFLH